MGTMKLTVVIEPGERSGWIGSVPALPGCHSQGGTKEELLENLRDAAQGWIEAEEEKRNLSIPNHRELDPGTLRSLIRSDGLTVEEFEALRRSL